MANPQRGEVEIELDGKVWTLCLTLGSLAHLEKYFEVPNLVALVERFSNGEFSAADLVEILVAGMQGGGHEISRNEVAQMHSSAGVTGFATAVTDLLNASFGDQGSSQIVHG